eukprot:6495-Heterococcus_DN1.PRE.2
MWGGLNAQDLKDNKKKKLWRVPRRALCIAPLQGRCNASRCCMAWLARRRHCARHAQKWDIHADWATSTRWLASRQELDQNNACLVAPYLHC